MPIVGLTGDVGAGKSTLCRVWRGMGAFVIDADTIARDMWTLPEIQTQAELRWGAGFFSGKRSEVLGRIASKIFTDGRDYEFAAGLLHEKTMRKIEELAKAQKGWVVAEIPLLFECGRPEWIDKVVYAAASLGKRAARNAPRGWDAEEISRRGAKMMPREVKMRLSDYVIENNGTLPEWEEKGRLLAEKILDGARR